MSRNDRAAGRPAGWTARASAGVLVTCFVGGGCSMRACSSHDRVNAPVGTRVTLVILAGTARATMTIDVNACVGNPLAAIAPTTVECCLQTG